MAGRDVRSAVEPFATAVTDAAGDNLFALLVRGSAARGNYDPKRSDVNLVLILEDTSAGALRPLGPAVAKWVKRGQPPPVIFSTLGWKQSTDVFPIELEDMREAHLLIRGEDPFADVSTTPEDTRRELEGEARGKLLQLRAEYVAAATDGKVLGALLASSAKTFFVLFRSLLRLRGEPRPESDGAMVSAVADLIGFDRAPFEWAVARHRGDKQRDLAAHDPLGAQYLEAIEAFVAFVDSL